MTTYQEQVDRLVLNGHSPENAAKIAGLDGADNSVRRVAVAAAKRASARGWLPVGMTLDCAANSATPEAIAALADALRAVRDYRSGSVADELDGRGTGVLAVSSATTALIAGCGGQIMGRAPIDGIVKKAAR